MGLLSCILGRKRFRGARDFFINCTSAHIPPTWSRCEKIVTIAVIESKYTRVWYSNAKEAHVDFKEKYKSDPRYRLTEYEVCVKFH